MRPRDKFFWSLTYLGYRQILLVTNLYRVLTSRRRLRMQTRKSSPTYCYVLFRIQSSSITFRNIETKARNEKRLILSRPFIYYNNTSATQRVILSGGIESNPRPTKKNNHFRHSHLHISAATCDSCEKKGRSSSKRLKLSHCKNHQKWNIQSIKIPLTLYPRVNCLVSV